MPTYNIVKLMNMTPVHIGTGKDNYDFSASELQSDTLSSALAAIRAQNGKDEDTEVFLNTFTLSSAFPFIGNRFFLPKMKGQIDVESDDEEHVIRKKLKRIRYIESETWSDLVQGKRIKIEKDQLNGDFLSNDSKLDKFSKNVVHQRVFVPREESCKTEPFFFEWKFFQPDSGLFCLVDCEETIFEEIVNLFKVLGVNGIGTDKNLGGGKFDIEVGQLTLPDIVDANHTMLLSLYIPKEAEINDLDLTQSKFDLLLRGGFMAGSNNEKFRHLRKKSIYMFGVGSLFPLLKQLHGKVVDLKPDWNDTQMHSVFKSGKPFCFPVKKVDYE